MLKLLTFAAVLSCFAARADAGWYDVENFEGVVGSTSIRLSIQRYDSFGSGITVEGSYFLASDMTPVPLYGKEVGGKLELCVIASQEQFEKILVQGSKAPVDTTDCPIVIDVSANRATGTWRDGTNSLPVVLKKVAVLNDTSDAVITGNLEIPFWTQTADHVFFGHYEKAGSDICMTGLRIVNRTTRRIDQEIPFGTEPCDAGMVMTPIYMNIEKQDDDTILVNFRDGGMGFTKTFGFDRQTNKFIERN